MAEGLAAPRPSLRGRMGVCLALAVLVMVGGWLRLRHLGRLGLVADEGYQALAVSSILEHGVPRFESRYVYARAVPFLYLQAMAADAFGLNEFSLRLPAAVCSLVAIVLVYWLGRAVFDWRVGLVAAALMAVSVWEIELSRYGRFYTALQCAYLVGLLCFYWGYLRGRRAAQVGFFLAAAAAILFHELGVMLATCFLIPLCLDRTSPRRKPLYLVGILLVAGLWAGSEELTKSIERVGESAALRADGGGASPVEGLPPPSVSASAGLPAAPGAATQAVVAAAQAESPRPRASATWGGTIKRSLWRISRRVRWPDGRLVVRQLSKRSGTFMALSLLVVGVSLLLGYRGVRRGGLGRKLFAVAMIGAAWTHQFGVFTALWIAYVFACVRSKEDLNRQPLSTVHVMAVICLVYWLFVVWWHTGIARLERLFDYPHFYRYFLVWLVKGWPVLLAVFAAGVALLARRAWRDPQAIEPRFVLGAIFVPAVVASGLGFGRYAARYIFHLYPLILLVAAYAAVRWWERVATSRGPRGLRRRRAAVAGLAAAVLVANADTNPFKAWAVGARTYRSVRDPIRGPINATGYALFHQDQLTPSEYVRGHRKPHDRVVALGPYYQVAIFRHYVGRVDYTVAERAKRYQLKTKRGGKVVDRVTGHQVFTDVGDLEAFLAKDRDYGVWVLADRNLLLPENGYYSQPMKAYLATLAERADYIGLDGTTFARKVQ